MLGSPGICHLLLWLHCHQPQPRPGTTAAGSCVQRGQTCPIPATGPHESPSAPGTGRQQWEEPAQEPGTSMKEEVPRQRAAGRAQAPLLSLGSGWSCWVPTKDAHIRLLSPEQIVSRHQCMGMCSCKAHLQHDRLQVVSPPSWVL